MEWIAHKWGGRPHRRGAMLSLGDDEHGRWCWGPKGGAVTFGHDTVRTREHDLVCLFPEDWWSAIWWVGHPEVVVYVDIGTPPEWTKDEVVTVDLDLDIVEFLDGRVEVADRDEFELHRERYGYPPDVIEAAERAAIHVERQITDRIAPFDEGTVRSWFARVEAARRDLEGSER